MRRPRSTGFLGAGDHEPRRVGHLPLILSGAVLLAAIAISLIVPGDDEDRVRTTVSPTPMTAQERCVVAVMDLLSQTLQALQQGDTSGLNLDQVATEYGTESPTFKAFAYTQSDLISRVIAHGAAGQLTAIQPEAQQQCGAWS